MAENSDLWRALKMLRDTFRRYSTLEGDPTILTRGGVKELFVKELGDSPQSLTGPKLEELFKSLDDNADGAVDFAEFLQFLLCVNVIYFDCEEENKETDLQMSMRLIVDTFMKYTENGGKSGLTKAQLKQMFQEQLKSPLQDRSDAELDKLFKELEDNGDQVVDLDEFCQHYFVYVKLLHKLQVVRAAAT